MRFRFTAFASLLCLPIVPTSAQTFGVEPQVVFTTPTTIPVNGLIWEGAPQDGAGLPGQPRIANDGTVYLTAALPLPPGPTPIDYVRNFFLLQDGNAFIREGLEIPGAEPFVPLSDFPLSQQPYQDIDLNSTGSIAQILTGTDVYLRDGKNLPDANDLAFPDADPIPLLLLDRELVIKDGDEVDILPGVIFPRNALVDLSAADLNDNGSLLVRGSLDTGIGQFDADTLAIFRIDDPVGARTIVPMIIADEDFLLPGLGVSVSTYAANEADLAFNDSNAFITSIDIRGASGTEDGAIALYDDSTGTYSLLAREGQPSAIPGRNWVSVFNVPVALNNVGDWAFRGRVSGDSTTNSILVRNNAIVAQEGDTVDSITGPRVLQLGNADANIQMDDAGNIVWYAAWNAPKADVCPDNTDITSSFAIWEGLYLNDELLIEGGRTVVRDVTIDGTLFPELVVADVPNTIGGFSLSPDGRTLIVSLLVAEPDPDICAYSINNDATPLGSVVLTLDVARILQCRLADTNNDGEVTPADFNAWVAAFNASDDAADQNGDGLVNPADFNAWIANFNACG
ncbi:MAG: GC-type dockerin domain-anchored protein [Planctomycetota bacterium]